MVGRVVSGECNGEVGGGMVVAGEEVVGRVMVMSEDRGVCEGIEGEDGLKVACIVIGKWIGFGARWCYGLVLVVGMG